jgi:hypothetical protein
VRHEPKRGLVPRALASRQIRRTSSLGRNEHRYCAGGRPAAIGWVLLRLTSRQTVERWRLSERAISNLLQPCLLRAASIYLFAGVNWQYVMANILFLFVENLRQYCDAPPLEGSVLNLVYESASPNNVMHPTRHSAALIIHDSSGRVMPGIGLLHIL